MPASPSQLVCRLNCEIKWDQSRYSWKKQTRETLEKNLKDLSYVKNNIIVVVITYFTKKTVQKN